MAAAEPGPDAAGATIEVVYCPTPGVVDRVQLRLPQGATLAQALAASGLMQRHALGPTPALGVWGRAKASDTVLRERDRVEIYRALLVDPKEARRQRYRKAGRAGKTGNAGKAAAGA